MRRGQGLVSTTEIAALVNRRVSAVSNWRANPKLGFPAPRGGNAGRPMFDLDEVLEWLRTNRPDIEINLGGGERLVWAAVNELRDAWEVEDLVDFLLALLAARRASLPLPRLFTAWQGLVRSDPASLESRLQEVTTAAHAHGLNIEFKALGADVDADTRRRLLNLIKTVDSAEEDELPAVADLALTRLTASKGRAGSDVGSVTSRVSAMLGHIANSHEWAESVYDPTCGIGQTILAAHRYLPHAEFIGHEIDPDVLTMARRRWLIADVHVDSRAVDVLAEDPDPTLRADLVLADPPLGMSWRLPQALTDPRWTYGLPSKSAADLLFLQHCLHHLSEDGYAYVLTTQGPLYRGGADRRVRTDLLRAGRVEAVVALPQRMLSHTSIPLALWVLRGEAVQNDEVFLIDATDTRDPEAGVSVWLAEADQRSSDQLPRTARVLVNDLLLGDADLSPARWVARKNIDPGKIRTRFALADLAVAGVRQGLADMPPIPDLAGTTFSQPRMASIGELVDLEVAAVVRNGYSEDDFGDAPFVIVRRDDIVAQELQPVFLDGDEVQEQWAEDRTEPGDVLFTVLSPKAGRTAKPRLLSMVDEDGDHLLSREVLGLRVDPSVCDPRYVAECLTGSWNDHLLQAGRFEPKSLQIPLIPLDEQRQIGDLIDIAREYRQLAAGLHQAMDDYVPAVLEVVAHHVPIPSSSSVEKDQDD